VKGAPELIHKESPCNLFGAGAFCVRGFSGTLGQAVGSHFSTSNDVEKQELEKDFGRYPFPSLFFKT
jgi:hypothetical protein